MDQLVYTQIVQSREQFTDEIMIDGLKIHQYYDNKIILGMMTSQWQSDSALTTGRRVRLGLNPGRAC